MGYNVNITPSVENGDVMLGPRFRIYSTNLANYPPPPENFAYRAIRVLERIAYMPNGADSLANLLNGLEATDMRFYWQAYTPGTGPSCVHIPGSHNIWMQ